MSGARLERAGLGRATCLAPEFAAPYFSSATEQERTGRWHPAYHVRTNPYPVKGTNASKRPRYPHQSSVPARAATRIRILSPPPTRVSRD